MSDFLLDLASHGLTRISPVGMLLYLLVMTQLTTLSVTLYLHRGQTHRAVDFHPLLAHAFRFWLWLTTAMVVRQWVAVHRKHHAHSDTAQDPHSPQVYGISTLLWKGVELYSVARHDPATLDKYGRGTPDDWIERRLYTPHCNWGPTVLAVTNLLLFGVIGMALWAVQMMWIPFWGGGVINGLGHWCGYRNFETADRSANLMPWAFWVGGEELHNNHHAFPGSAKFAVRRGEFDLGWAIIRALAWCRLATVRRVAVVPAADAATPGGAQPAQLTPRVRWLTAYFRQVMLPAVRSENRRRAAGARKLSLRLRHALADGGHWLGMDDRASLLHWVEARPHLRLLWDYRAQLAALLEQRDLRIARAGLAQWSCEAQASGIASLCRFAAALTMHLGMQPTG